MAKYIEDLSQFLQSFGVAPLALLVLPVLIAAWARNVTLALATSLLSFASLMLFIAPASATSGLAIASGLGSFLAALESIKGRPLHAGAQAFRRNPRGPGHRVDR